MVDFHLVNPAVARVLIISWLLKDFGWMTTNIYLGFTFGFISVLFHYIMIMIDTRADFRFYNFSLFFWVTGNFIWMTLEFVVTNPSSYVHIGPAVPLGGISDNNADLLVQFKTFLFFVGALIQLIMYMGILLGKLRMPEDDEEDDELLPTKREFYRVFYGDSSGGDSSDSGSDHSGFGSATISKSDSEEIGDSAFADDSKLMSFNVNSNNSHYNSSNSDRINLHNNGKNDSYVSLAFMEHSYIVFWISKDLFWSWGTGDLSSARELAGSFEIMGMFFGVLSIMIYIFNAYLSRMQVVRFVDCLTTVCWILANYIWMCGEFFIRYQHLNLDDSNQGHDNITRVISSVLFCIGFSMQMGNIIYLSYKDKSSLFKIVFGKICYNWRNSRKSPFGDNSRYKKLNRSIEILPLTSSQKNRSSNQLPS